MFTVLVVWLVNGLAHLAQACTCQLSRLRVENFDLVPAHACGPISVAWLKNVSCCGLAWHNFHKCVNSDPWKERKPCVKWTNDNSFLAISDFYQLTSVLVDKRFLDNFAFGRLRTSLEDFGLLGNLQKWSQHSQDKNPTLISQKKLAGIQASSLVEEGWMLVGDGFLFYFPHPQYGEMQILTYSHYNMAWIWQLFCLLTNHLFFVRLGCQ